MNKSACVLIATYNEASTIGDILTILNNEYNLDVFIIDDNSPDGTAVIAKAFSKTKVIVRTDKKGIASAYIDGFKHITDNYQYDYVVQMDAGLTHNPHDVPKMIAHAIKNNADLVIGSRSIKQQKIISYRTLLSKIAIYLMKLIHINQNDVTSGFRCWKNSLLKNIWYDFIDAKGFGFQLQMLYNATFLKAKINEYPVEYKLTNSSLNRKIIWEAFCVWFHLWFYVDGTDHNLTLKHHYKQVKIYE